MLAIDARRRDPAALRRTCSFLLLQFWIRPHVCGKWSWAESPLLNGSQPPGLDWTYQGLVVNLLPDELVLAEGVAGFSCDRVDRPLLHLLLYGTVEHEERLAGALLEEKHAGAMMEEDRKGWAGGVPKNI